ncbi:PP2C family protein-serine/threonine phosphatase [Candidatus Chloroploca sp. Khr17]|uniref:PP2C family protein-serine/threonine phosphatase n=1 Tax=Candidatus Chloroploca sp. Khr17 TaxID=2496869 RepID=UPI001F0E5F84|nr:SpoIIE family protein phosphatase [Candidatus Chloroploca sp. Khr17]
MTESLLREVSFFRDLPLDALRSLAETIAYRQLNAGALLFAEGEAGHECFIILEGNVDVLTYVNGNELRLDTFGAGHIVGEMALIDRSPRSATVRAVADTKLIALGEDAFKTLLRSNPDLAMQMLSSGSARVREANRRMIAGLERKNAELTDAYRRLQAMQAELVRLNRLEEELAVARRIQTSFLPKHLPQPEGWQLTAMSREAQAVGGDFFDCIELPDQLLGLVVADACGKGVTAALFVALTRSLLRAASLSPRVFQCADQQDAETILADALWLVNDYLCREHGDNTMFITLFYGLLDPRTGILAYVNAGHNPPLIVDGASATLGETELGSMPLGILPDQQYHVQHTVINPGCRLVMFSDGITEALDSHSEMFGEGRLREVLTTNALLAAPALMQGIIDAVDRHIDGAAQSDDITILVVSRM